MARRSLCRGSSFILKQWLDRLRVKGKVRLW